MGDPALSVYHLSTPVFGAGPVGSREQLPVLGAGAFLIITGTVTYSVGNNWSIVDGFYFAVATLTTSSIADPELVLHDNWMKLFTVFYILIGIGILVEVARRFGMAFIEVRREEKSRSDNPGTA